MKQTLQNMLENVPNTTILVSKFIKLLESYKSDENKMRDALISFKEIYKVTSYYEDVKENIIQEVSMLGMDTYDINQYLS